VFSAVAKVKPRTLLVVGDGPRADHTTDEERVAATRTVIDKVDWDCEVRTNLAEHNLGCRKRVSTGIDWIFDVVEEAIILEDDCVPDPTFFRYSEELLTRYRDDVRVGMIGGANFQFGRRHGSASYYFSRYGHVWGWATWRRAWRHYDVGASDWPRFRDRGELVRVLGNRPREIAYWERVFDSVTAGRIDTWDYQWLLTLWSREMLAAVPQENLVTNIGFGGNATHTRSWSAISNVPTQKIEFPLIHPSTVAPARRADDRTGNRYFTPTVTRRAASKLRRAWTALAGWP
jgi:hypothetical protein